MSSNLAIHLFPDMFLPGFLHDIVFYYPMSFISTSISMVEVLKYITDELIIFLEVDFIFYKRRVHLPAGLQPMRLRRSQSSPGNRRNSVKAY